MGNYQSAMRYLWGHRWAIIAVIAVGAVLTYNDASKAPTTTYAKTGFGSVAVTGQEWDAPTGTLRIQVENRASSTVTIRDATVDGASINGNLPMTLAKGNKAWITGHATAGAAGAAHTLTVTYVSGSRTLSTTGTIFG